MLKQKTITILCILITTLSYGQIKFEKGYFINNAGLKTECFIQNIDWNNNPTEFLYRITKEETPKNATIQTIKEFGIHGVSIFQRHTVKLDISSELSGNLSTNRRPEFEEKTLFLKILTKGDAALYMYRATNFTRFFYKVATTSLEPLIYKRYIGADNYTIHPNNYFRQQLYNTLKCDRLQKASFDNLSYYKNELITIFETFNLCKDNSYRNKIKNENRGFLHLTPKIGIQQGNLDINNTNSSQRDVDFGTEIGFRVGIELEYSLPFNKNKWSVILNPTYQHFTSEKVIKITQQDVLVEADYSTIELPISLRHYFFITDQTKIFAQGSYALSFDLNSKINFDTGSVLEVGTVGNFAIGLGVMYKKYSVQLQYDLNRDLLTDFAFWSSNYSIFSLSIGYQVF